MATTGPTGSGHATDASLPRPPDLGVIGGMGPAATTNFLRQLDGLTVAERDQDHLAYVVWGDPRIPDRSDALLGRGASPLPHLTTAVTALAGLGVRLIAMPCNTAHHWIEDMSAMSPVPIVDMIAETARRTAELHPGAQVCILATLGTSSSPLYRDRLIARGLHHITLDAVAQDVVEASIRAVKAHDLHSARHHLDEIELVLDDHPAEVAIIACTDLSFLLVETGFELGLPTIDASEALARSCLEHFGVRTVRGG